MDEEREIQGQVHRGLLNHWEDAVSLCAAELDLGLSPFGYLLATDRSQIRQSLRCPASGVLTHDLGEEYRPCKVVKIK